MQRLLPQLALSCTVAMTGTATGQSGVPHALDACAELQPAEAQAKLFVLHPVLGGAELQRRVERVQQLPWQRTLAEARGEALRRGRPVLWLQSLGDLEGFA
jgi:hypothetical protein